MNNILLLGDSITQLSWDPTGAGWASLLQNNFQRRAQFITRGFGGYSTEAAVNVILPKLGDSLKFYTQNSKKANFDQRSEVKNVESDKNSNTESNSDSNSNNQILAATIFFGANDSVLSTCEDNAQHVPLKSFIKNTKLIINYLQNTLKIKTIILITLPLYDDEAWKVACCKKYNLASVESKRSIEHSGTYRKAVIEIAEEMEDVEVCDFWGAMERETGWKELLSDGLHLSTGGQKLLFQILVPIFERVIPVEMRLPHWSLL
jgi:lysophospholipase L1-like esterase